MRPRHRFCNLSAPSGRIRPGERHDDSKGRVMNDNERAALVQEVTGLVFQAGVSHASFRTDISNKTAEKIVNLIEKSLLTDHVATVPGEDAVERAAKAINAYHREISPHSYDEWEHESERYKSQTRGEARAALAAGSAPGPGLDELLDSVSDSTPSVYVGLSWGGRTFVAEIFADDASDSDPATVISKGTGLTRMGAIRNAVAAARPATAPR